MARELMIRHNSWRSIPWFTRIERALNLIRRRDTATAGTPKDGDRSSVDFMINRREKEPFDGVEAFIVI